MIDESAIKAKRDELTKQRDDYVAQANQQIAMFNGAIAVCDQLLGVGVVVPENDKPAM